MPHGLLCFAYSLVSRCKLLTKLIIYSEHFGADPHPEKEEEEKYVIHPARSKAVSFTAELRYISDLSNKK